MSGDFVRPEDIDSIQARLWSAADDLRANSGLASNEYFMPVMGILFLRHAHHRYLAVKPEIEATLPSRGGKQRALTKEDFSSAAAIFLQPHAQYDNLVALPDSTDRAKAIIEAMESIESDYEGLKGVLPKAEFNELGNDVIGSLLRKLNPSELKDAEGDVFGRIYEYFLTNFAGDKAHDGGEFFTPISLVSLIANVIEVDSGIILDPACGSGGMFVQSARLVEQTGASPSEKLTFIGMEKNATTIRLAKMNLAVHGLEGDIQQANTYYEDPHKLVGKADGLMANPPFNVDEIDASKIKTDKRLAFGLPGVSKGTKLNPEKKGKVTEQGGNYVWISYFHSYLKSGKGRGGFVMPSSASGAGGTEATIRKKLIETGDVVAIVTIRSGFFYTRTVPCELWFIDRGKSKDKRDKVLMIDARDINRKVTRTVYDFSPEQERNLLSIVWLYRGQTERFLELLADYCQRCINEALSLTVEFDSGNTPFSTMATVVEDCMALVKPFIDSLQDDSKLSEDFANLLTLHDEIKAMYVDFKHLSENLAKDFAENDLSNETLSEAVTDLSELANLAENLVSRQRSNNRELSIIVNSCRKSHDAKNSDLWSDSKISNTLAAANDAFESIRYTLNGEWSGVHYFWRMANWLTSNFPEAELHDVGGLVKLVEKSEIEANKWKLTPGYYVGVSPIEDEGLDFQLAMREIHTELADLNKQAEELASTIQSNFEELGT